MGSTFTWLDYSEHERRKMLDALTVWGEKDTRDELGIGAIRDGFADILFPGTSTIQTRARYFLFVPWIYQAQEQKKRTSANISYFAREWEISLITALIKSEDRRGIIGIDAREKLKRLPSNIYWRGLGTWGIRQFAGSQDQCHRSLDGFYETRGQTLRSDDNDLVSGMSEPNWHPNLPPKPKDFPWEADFSMRPEDSEYLKQRIRFNVGNSLLGHLVCAAQAPSETEFVWESEQYAEFPEDLRHCVDHARFFSETIHGAALLYNLMLARQAKSEPLTVTHTDSIQEWFNLIEARGRAIRSWDLDSFWSTLEHAEARVPSRSHAFVMAWLKRALALPSAEAIATDRELHDLILNRERSLKRAQARLSNPRALELWSGAAGTGRLAFRWGVSRTMVTDIIMGLSDA